jgi:hypothetical protein
MRNSLEHNAEHARTGGATQPARAWSGKRDLYEGVETADDGRVHRPSRSSTRGLPGSVPR